MKRGLFKSCALHGMTIHPVEKGLVCPTRDSKISREEGSDFPTRDNKISREEGYVSFAPHGITIYAVKRGSFSPTRDNEISREEGPPTWDKLVSHEEGVCGQSTVEYGMPGLPAVPMFAHGDPSLRFSVPKPCYSTQLGVVQLGHLYQP